MSMNWWRAHHGISNDSKLAVCALRANARRCEVLAVWIACLDFASQQDPRGSVAGIDAEELAVMSDIPGETVAAILEVFRAKELITQDGTLTSWDKRQPKREDYSAERVRAHAKRKLTQANASSDKLTQANAGSGQIRLDTDTEEKREEQSADVLPPQKPKIAQMPTRGAKADYEDLLAAWKWYQSEYPTEVNKFMETQLFLSVVETPEDIADLKRNLLAYKQTPKWLSGYPPSSENFLSKRIFKIAPKVQETAAPPQKLSALDRLIQSAQQEQR